MRNHRFYSEKQHLQIGDVVLLSDFDAKHIKKTLRLNTGHKIILFDGIQEYNAELKTVSNNNTTAKIISIIEIGQVKNKIILFHALIKQQNLELIAEKISELGASELVTFSSDYSQIKDLPDKKIERLRKIAISAAKQSERINIMEVNNSINFEEAIELAKRTCVKIYFFSSRLESHQVLAELDLEGIEGNIAIFIGPEGGFSTGEDCLAKDEGFEIVSIENKFYPRKLILRSETAAIVAVALVVGRIEVIKKILKTNI